MSVSAYTLKGFADDVKENGKTIQTLKVENASLETNVKNLNYRVKTLESKQGDDEKQYAELDKKVAIIDSKRAP